MNLSNRLLVNHLASFALVISLFLSSEGVSQAGERNSAADCGEVTVTKISGRVTIISGGTDSPAAVGSKLGQGDHLKTSSGAWAEVRLHDGTSLHVNENSDLEPADRDGCDWGFCFGKGSLQAAGTRNTAQANGKANFRLRTPTGTILVKSSGFSVLVEGDQQQITRVRSTGGELLVGPYLGWEEFRSENSLTVKRLFLKLESGQSSTVIRGDTQARRD